MTAPYTLIDLAALDLTSETGQQNALATVINNINTVLDLLNSAGTTVPLLGTGNSGGLLSASQKLILTGGGNADSLHHHAGGGGGGGFDPTAALLLATANSNFAAARILTGLAGQIALNDLGAGGQLTIGLAVNGVVPGSYAKVTVDNKGRVSNGGALSASDLPAHTHSALDLTSGSIPAARFGNVTVPLAAINPGAVTDGWIPIASGGSLVMAAAPAGTGEVNTATNVGTSGQGLFKQKTGANLEFRSIDIGLGLLETLNGVTNAIVLAPDFGAGTNQIPRGDHTHDARYYQKSEVDNLVKVLSVVNKTLSYIATASDQLITVDSTAGAVTITLPDASTNIGKVLRVKRTNGYGTTTTVHVVPAGSDNIDGLYTDWELWDKNEYVVLVATAGSWQIIDASGSIAPIGVGNVGVTRTDTVKPQKQYLVATATINNGVWNIQGMYLGQTAHLVVMSGLGSVNTIIDVIGQGRALWPNNVQGGVGHSQPPMTLIPGRQDEIYALWNGQDTLFSFRGQSYL
jgi:hypothetical protein